MFGIRFWGQTMYEVVIARDAESGYFYVHESNIIGLQACAPTMDALMEVIQDVAPDLIQANHKPRPRALSTILKPLLGQRETHIKVSRELCIA